MSLRVSYFIKNFPPFQYYSFNIVFVWLFQNSSHALTFTRYFTSHYIYTSLVFPFTVHLYHGNRPASQNNSLLTPSPTTSQFLYLLQVQASSSLLIFARRRGFPSITFSVISLSLVLNFYLPYDAFVFIFSTLLCLFLPCNYHSSICY